MMIGTKYLKRKKKTICTLLGGLFKQQSPCFHRLCKEVDYQLAHSWTDMLSVPVLLIS